MRLAAFGCRWLLGALFLVAGCAKALDPGGFVRDIDGYRMLEGPLLVGAAFFIPFFEVAVGTALVLRWPYRGAVVAAGGMLAVFLVALVQAWARGLDINCGCFGDGPGLSGYPWWVARDAAMLLACAVCWTEATKGPGPDEGGAR